jgi:hypothetical protein
MSGKLKWFGTICGIAASAMCLWGGLWILAQAHFNRGDDALAIGIGLYFIGKALFVGPMLIIASRQGTSQPS